MKSCQFIWYVLLLLLAGCKERFEVDIPASKQNFLVVEGFINANGTTLVKLSRTVPLNVSKSFVPEKKATVFVEANDNTPGFPVLEKGDGLYASTPMLLSINKQYRLNITTADGKKYLSKFLPVIITPEIDSISWREESGGVRIFASTHDPLSKSLYYQWTFQETWEIHSAFDAIVIYENGVIRDKTATDPNMYECWKDASSTDILLGSSAKLVEDKIHLQPLHFIERGEERLGIRYSILVKQLVLDKEGYEFFEQMKKNTESLGSIFDPQPSALRGNVVCTSHPKDLVIGYINVGTETRQRLFISRRELSGRGFSMSAICQSDEISKSLEDIRANIPERLPYLPVYSTFPPIELTGYKISAPACVDCRKRNATNVKPSFW